MGEGGGERGRWREVVSPTAYKAIKISRLTVCSVLIFTMLSRVL